MINNKPINIRLLTSLIFKAKYIISNDTGPAHICSHLNKKGYSSEAIPLRQRSALEVRILRQSM